MLSYCQLRITLLSAEQGEKKMFRLGSPAHGGRANPSDVTNLLALQKLGIDKTEV